MAISFIGTIGVETARQSVNYYGKKALGLEQLATARETYRLPYKVPPGFIQPIGTKLTVDRALIGDAYHKLTADLAGPTVIYARSSSPYEEPGKYLSVPSLFTPQDRQGSFEHYLAACNQVLQSGGEIAIIGQIMVGKPEVVNGMNCIGYSNASFVASYPSPLKRNMVTISSVAGLATKAVEENCESVVFHSDPQGKIEYALWLDGQEYYENNNKYRQKGMHVYDIDQMRFLSLHGSIPNYKVIDPEGNKDTSDPCTYALSPFHNKSDVIALNKLIPQLSALFGESIEVEGAYMDQELFLWQTRNIPPKPYSNITFTSPSTGDPIINSDDVLGCLNCKTDLVYITTTDQRVAHDRSALLCNTEIEKIFAKLNRSGQYALFSDVFVSGVIIETTYASVIAVTYYANPLSHLIGGLLERSAKGKAHLIMHSASVAGFSEDKANEVLLTNDYLSLKILLFKDVVVESDGDRAQIFLPTR
ncbi:MAG: hypothetical protein PHH14_07140 [Candidatus Margulisbacteria bacterium]|nr:hypothetical protein [Candidatus Margulisiibacteriota bacterium]